MTRVFGPTRGLASSAAVSVSQSLTANSTTSTGPTSFGIGRGVDLRQVQVAVHAFDLEAVLAQRIEMGAARDVGDVMARGLHPSAEIGADRAGRHRCDFHVRVLRICPDAI